MLNRWWHCIDWNLIVNRILCCESYRPCDDAATDFDDWLLALTRLTSSTENAHQQVDTKKYRRNDTEKQSDFVHDTLLLLVDVEQCTTKKVDVKHYFLLQKLPLGVALAILPIPADTNERER